jgi:soluble lytic murein transglycosylase-like protein
MLERCAQDWLMPARLTVRGAPLVVAFLVMALPAAAAADVPHVVQPGETLTSVARIDGLSISAVAAANDLSPTAELIVGQVLEIPALTADTAAHSTGMETDAAQSAAQRVVTSTSTASHTAAATDTDGDADDRTVTTNTVTSAATHTTTTVATKAPLSTSSAAPQPTVEHVSAAEIAQIASAGGVPPGLAEGIAWQESGWNNDVVSGIGAVGVMQIVPTTWTWIDQYLTPSDPLGTASAAENVRGGVLLLHQLLALTDNNYTLAVASYYQGLASVRKYGLYADTKQYVADVLALASRFDG